MTFSPTRGTQVVDAVPDKSTPIVVTCWGGGNSRVAANLLVTAGYRNVSQLYFGFSSSAFSTSSPVDLYGDYKSQGLPIESVSFLKAPVKDGLVVVPKSMLQAACRCLG